jgi:hypothetical protein
MMHLYTGKIMDKERPYKQCKRCRKTWRDSSEFLSDPELRFHAYQASFEELETGLFLFEHSCKTTLSIQAGEFSHLYQGPVFKERATGTEECPGFCGKAGNLEPCTVECECAYIREVMQIIRYWPKDSAGVESA